jgi:hypothetical protein
VTDESKDCSIAGAQCVEVEVRVVSPSSGVSDWLRGG